MAANYTDALANNRLDEVTALLDVSQPGELVITTTANGTDLAVIDLLNPSFPAAASRVLTMASSISDTSADNTGTAAQARIQDGAAADVITGLTVGVTAEDIVLDSATITQAQTVTINTMTITHAA